MSSRFIGMEPRNSGTTRRNFSGGGSWLRTVALCCWTTTVLCLLVEEFDRTEKSRIAPFVAAFSPRPVRPLASKRSTDGAFSSSSSSSPPSSSLRAASNGYQPVVVVGKIIIDEYGNPIPERLRGNANLADEEVVREMDAADRLPPQSVSVGGGGPQAAFGAAAALAVWDERLRGDDSTPESPPPIIFVAPVGGDWTPDDTHTLQASGLGAPARVVVHDQCIDANNHTVYVSDADPSIRVSAHLVRTNGTTAAGSGGGGLVTPRIRLWHDDEQIVHWYALGDSFGPKGADGLWRRTPSACDVLAAVELEASTTNNTTSSMVLHAIAETWEFAAGNQEDVVPLLGEFGEKGDISRPSPLLPRLSHVGLEPVASGTTVTKKDASIAWEVLQTIGIAVATAGNASLSWCPDRALDQALHELLDSGGYERAVESLACVATRDGPRGSELRFADDDVVVRIPAARLATPGGAPVDPTGAGNAFAGAWTALRGHGVTPTAAAAIATGVGAVVCEHEGLPPSDDWAGTLARIAAAADEVRSGG